MFAPNPALTDAEALVSFAEDAEFKFAPTLTFMLTEKSALSGFNVPTCKLFEDGGMKLSF
jgi:hypothetical protein